MIYFQILQHISSVFSLMNVIHWTSFFSLFPVIGRRTWLNRRGQEKVEIMKEGDENITSTTTWPHYSSTLSQESKYWRVRKKKHLSNESQRQICFSCQKAMIWIIEQWNILKILLKIFIRNMCHLPALPGYEVIIEKSDCYDQVEVQLR